MKKRLLIKTLSLLITAILLLEAFPYTTETKAYDSDSDRVIVSLGDSFSSGEGLGDYYNTYLDKKNKETPIYDKNTPIEEKVTNEDWLAHRSTLSWPGRLSLNGVDGTMADNRNTHWFFAAVSGAETKHLNTKQQEKKYNKDHGRLDNSEDPTKLPLQLDVFNTLKSKNLKADYVTITIGGNDAGFTKVITDAALPRSTYLHPGKLQKRLIQTTAKLLTYDVTADFVATNISPNGQINSYTISNFDFSNVEFAESGSIYKGLCQAYEDIHNAAGEQANIIVAGYPKLINNASSLFFNKDEVHMINTAISLFNYGIEKLVTRYHDTENMPIYFVNVEKAFEGEEAYTLNAAIHEIDPTPEKEDIDDRIWNNGINPSARSMHPTDKGAEIYAKCVQDMINKLETQGTNNNTTTQTTTQQQINTEPDSFYNEQFYQQQQFNMQRGGYYPDGHFIYDENTVYYHAYTTEYGNWLKSADDIYALKMENGGVKNTATDSSQIQICFSDSWTVSDTHIYYIRFGKLCRLAKTKKTNAENINSWSPNYTGFTDEVLYEGIDMQYILSKKYIFILDGSELIRINHDGSDKKVIATGINAPLNWRNEPEFHMYTISENLYYVSDGKLHCYYSSPNTKYDLCDVPDNVELMCVSGNTLYFTKTELYATNDLDDQYTTTVFKYTEGDSDLEGYMSFVTYGSGNIFVDPAGAVYIAHTHGGGTPVSKFVNGTQAPYNGEAFNMNSGLSVYKDRIIGFDFMGEKIICAYTF